MFSLAACPPLKLNVRTRYQEGSDGTSFASYAVGRKPLLSICANSVAKYCFILVLLTRAVGTCSPPNPTFTFFPLASKGLPSSIVAGPDGAMWINQGFFGIEKIDTQGNSTTYPIDGANTQPNGITVGPDGALWFTFGSDRPYIGRITTNGAISKFPLAEARGTTFPAFITAGPDGALWFTDPQLDRIGRVTTSGTFTMYALPKKSFPEIIVVGPDGALWFAEVGTNKIGKITVHGDIEEFSVPTSNSQPYMIVAGPDGALWFSELGSDKIGRITTNGTITEYGGATGPEGLAVGPDGALWFTERDAAKIGRLTTEGKLTEYSLPSTSRPEFITPGPDGSLWFADRFNNAVVRISVVGSVIGVDSSFTPSAATWNSINIAYAPQIVVADAWGGVHKFPAEAILSSAPAGVTKGAYFNLNPNPFSGFGTPAAQFDIALQQIGSELANLKFIALDVEVVNSVNYPNDSNSVTLRNQWINEAIELIQSVNKTPLIYTRRTDWATITGGVTSFGCIPLWDQNFDGVPDLQNDGPSLNTVPTGPVVTHPWIPFAGWTSRVGKQYLQMVFPTGVDLDAFAPALLSGITAGLAVDQTQNTLISRSGFRLNHGNPAQYAQTVTVTNVGSAPILGPISLALDALPSNATLANGSGFSACTYPSASPFVSLLHGATLNPGESATVILNFNNPSNLGITYRPRVLAGSGSR